MKIIMLSLLSLLLIFPLAVSAHTTVKTSTPTEGEEITQELTELFIEFAGEIEDQSTLTLTKENEEQSFDTVTVQGSKLIGTLNSPLTNGSYVLSWKIAAKDGHILTGEIPFTVNLPATEESNTTNGESDKEAEAPSVEGSNQNDNEKASSVEEEQASPETETSVEETTNNSSFVTISVIILIIILISGVWILFRKKR
ncbi:copper resistance CopC family protein [Metabacillus sp. B2-18]|uniref:copper resistance CopC family protein n=1 Tax=Metabacillus sp. B2-18 TaxID=2897333 RepID=UPI001E474F6C|nr:copper resistance protein CopC [Metabacillus sp. B2-18]UGB32284.1 copper resistance protein CopC [Metabacillus sp. B2-18]